MASSSRLGTAGVGLPVSMVISIASRLGTARQFAQLIGHQLNLSSASAMNPPGLPGSPSKFMVLVVLSSGASTGGASRKRSVGFGETGLVVNSGSLPWL